MGEDESCLTWINRLHKISIWAIFLFVFHLAIFLCVPLVVLFPSTLNSMMYLQILGLFSASIRQT